MAAAKSFWVFEHASGNRLNYFNNFKLWTFNRGIYRFQATKILCPRKPGEYVFGSAIVENKL